MGGHGGCFRALDWVGADEGESECEGKENSDS